MFFSTDTRILVVAAHPDDEVLGCGGTIIKAVNCGAQVAVMFLGEGISARFPIGEYDSEEFNQETKKDLTVLLKPWKSWGCRITGLVTGYAANSMVRKC